MTTFFNKRKDITRVLFYIVGLFIMGLGIALNAISNFGAGPWDAVNIGLSYHLMENVHTYEIFKEKEGRHEDSVFVFIYIHLFKLLCNRD